MEQDQEEIFKEFQWYCQQYIKLSGGFTWMNLMFMHYTRTYISQGSLT